MNPMSPNQMKTSRKMLRMSPVKSSTKNPQNRRMRLGRPPTRFLRIHRTSLTNPIQTLTNRRVASRIRTTRPMRYPRVNRMKTNRTKRTRTSCRMNPMNPAKPSRKNRRNRRKPRRPSRKGRARSSENRRRRMPRMPSRPKPRSSILFVRSSALCEASGISSQASRSLSSSTALISCGTSVHVARTHCMWWCSRS